MGGEKEGAGVRGDLVALIKPQFEAGRKDVSRGDGVIRDPKIHRHVLMDVLAFAQREKFGLKGLIRSPILGPKGNVEFLAWLGHNSTGETVKTLVEKVIPEEEIDEMP
jgi:23S rRNA (cytidine1920-2'-O)/16S rRNA (cytidine1409-2'-O)-methyltransferase